MPPKEPYTVYAVFEGDGSQRYTAYVDATSPEDAEKRAAKNANAPILIAGVVNGYVSPVDAGSRKDVTPLHGRGYETWVNRLVASRERLRVPYHCPTCKEDLRKPDRLRQVDYVIRVWPGRIPRGAYATENHGVVVNSDLGPIVDGNKDHNIYAAQIKCANCGALIWNGDKKGS